MICKYRNVQKLDFWRGCLTVCAFPNVSPTLPIALWGKHINPFSCCESWILLTHHQHFKQFFKKRKYTWSPGSNWTKTYHTKPYHTIPYHTIPYHTIPCHTIPNDAISTNIGLQCGRRQSSPGSNCITPYHTIPYHTIAHPTTHIGRYMGVI